MGELKLYLGLKIKQTPKGIYIHQTKYVKELLKKFNMKEAKDMKTPMHPTTYLGLDEESTKVDRTQYRTMIGLLLYLAASRLNVMFSVCLCARFQKEQREVHHFPLHSLSLYLNNPTPKSAPCQHFLIPHYLLLPDFPVRLI